MAISSPRRAIEDDAAALIPLFCSGQEGIHLKSHVCSPERYPDLLRWMKQKCASSLVWTINEESYPIGMLVLDGRVRVMIQYVVVAKNFRGKRMIGPALVTHVQSLDDIVSLRAEARNDYSERMLMNCGFHRTDESVCGYPILSWERAVRKTRPRRAKARLAFRRLNDEGTT